MIEFKPFPKMPRLSRECVITEKLDGTNAQIFIEPAPPDYDPGDPANVGIWLREGLLIRAGSRTRWISPGKNDDNYGFAAWVLANATELCKLGPGQHFGEWWGWCIQRNYGLTEKRFSLFNASRWHADSINGGVFELTVDEITKAVTSRPGPRCCSVVPTLYFGNLSIGEADYCLKHLELNGSAAAPGFMQPEGIVIYHTAAKMCFKKTIKDDASPKSLI